MEWQTMDTAPKDGTKILLHIRPHLYVVGWWSDDKYSRKPRPLWETSDYMYGKTVSRMCPPLHWAPIVEPAK